MKSRDLRLRTRARRGGFVSELTVRGSWEPLVFVVGRTGPQKELVLSTSRGPNSKRLADTRENPIWDEDRPSSRGKDPTGDKYSSLEFFCGSKVCDTKIHVFGKPLRVSNSTILLEEEGHRHRNQTQKNQMGQRLLGHPSEPSTAARR